MGVLAVLMTVRYALAPWKGRAPVDAQYPYENPLMTDFRDTVVLPARALAQGINPYDITAYRQAFPHAQEFDPYAPWWLTVVSPLARLEWGHAALLWSAGLALATAACAAWAGLQAWRHLGDVCPTVASCSRSALVLWLATFVAFQWFWRPTTVGQGLGNVGALAGLAALLAVLGKHDRWYSVFLAVAWVKPQFGIPVVLILLARGHWRRALGGTLLAAVGSLPMVVQLSMAHGGLASLVRTVVDSATHLSNRSGGEPLEGRIDVAALFNVLGLHSGTLLPMTVGAVLLMAAAWLARRVAVVRPGVAALWVCLGLLVGFPHLHYDLAMLAPLMIWVVAEAWVRNGKRWTTVLRDPVLWVCGVLVVAGLAPGQAVLGGPGWSRAQGVLVQLCYLGMWGWGLYHARRSVAQLRDSWEGQDCGAPKQPEGMD